MSVLSNLPGGKLRPSLKHFDPISIYKTKNSTVLKYLDNRNVVVICKDVKAAERMRSYFVDGPFRRVEKHHVH